MADTLYHRSDSAHGEEGVDPKREEETQQMLCLIIMMGLKEHRRRKVKIKNSSATYPTKPHPPFPMLGNKFQS